MSPRTPTGDTRTNNVRLCCNDSEFLTLKRLASQAKQTVPEYLRALIQQAAAMDKQDARH